MLTDTMPLELSPTERADLERVLRATLTLAGIARRARCVRLRRMAARVWVSPLTMQRV